MSTHKVEEFRKQDKKEYEIEKNKIFLQWLSKQIKAGYHLDLEIKDLQTIINKIANWYEIKLPEREINPVFDTAYYYFINENIKRLSRYMTIDQLFLRLSWKELRFLECVYEGDTWNRRKEKFSDEIGEGYTTIFNIKAKTDNLNGMPNSFSVSIDSYTGTVLAEGELSNLIGERIINLEELLAELEQVYQDKYDFSIIKNSINLHQISLEVRRRVLKLVALRLLYSKDDQSQTGYIRAKNFIKEFNQRIPDLNLSSEEIDKIMDYNQSDKVKETPNSCKINVQPVTKRRK